MDYRTVYTRQHKGFIQVVEENGIFVNKKKYILEKMDTLSEYYLELYNWYIDRFKSFVVKPDYAEYPIWVSLSEKSMLQHVEGTIVIELKIPRDLVLETDIEKWGRIVNYWYVPFDRDDEERFKRKLEMNGLHDGSQAYMSNFYPHLKMEIKKSWERLFDNSYTLSNLFQGTIWEIKEKWITNIIK